MNKTPTCGVVVISNSVYDLCVLHATLFGEIKLFTVLWLVVFSF